MFDPRTAQVLRTAADRLERDGWCRDARQTVSGGLCAEEALCRSARAVAGVEGDWRDLAGDAIAAARLQLGGVPSLSAWNDHDAGNRHEVTAVFRAAADHRDRRAVALVPVVDAVPVPVVEMIDGGPPVPTPQLRPEDRLLVVERAVVELVATVDRFGDTLAEHMAAALAAHRQQTDARLDELDTKVATFAGAAAEDLAGLAGRVAALEGILAGSTADEAEAYLRARGDA